jgi:subtilisin family serine protease
LLAATGAPAPEFVPGEVLVHFHARTAISLKKSVIAKAGTVEEHILTAAMRTAGDNEGIYRLRTTRPVLEVVEELEDQPGVAYAEPNHIWRHQAVSNDPYYTNGSLWGMYGSAVAPTNLYGSKAAMAWANGNVGSNSIFVGIIDEGVQTSHPDLSPNIWVNPYDPVDGIDNDGNGYIDDRNGWDFNGNNNTVYDGPGDDHGTHVAGTVGARGGNGIGVAGVCWNVKMISCKFLGSSGGTTANAIKAFDYLTDLKNRHGLDIVASNNSWGGGGFSTSLQSAITRHGTANILAVVAAGNSNRNIDSSPSYPASYTNDNIISVASITSTGARSSFSNYGATAVDIGAPGSGIWSTVPTSSYSSYSGTSMAAPHVAGAAALWAATRPGDRGTLLKKRILDRGISTASMAGITVTGDRLSLNLF